MQSCENNTTQFPPRVLVAEDNPETVKVLRELLANAPFRWDIAQDGNEAVLMAVENEYSLLVLDAAMPNKSGFEVAQGVRDAGKDTPIVFFTAWDEPVMVSHAVQYGAPVWLKPEAVPKIQQLITNELLLNAESAGVG